MRRICNENTKTVIYQIRLYTNVTYQSINQSIIYRHISCSSLPFPPTSVGRNYTFRPIKNLYIYTTNIQHISYCILVAIETTNQSLYSLCLQSVYLYIIYIYTYSTLFPIYIYYIHSRHNTEISAYNVE